MTNAYAHYRVVLRVARGGRWLVVVLAVAAGGCNRSEPASTGKPTQGAPADSTVLVTPTPQTEPTPAPPAPKADPPSPEADLEAVRAAWRKAGARVGWMDEHKIDPPWFAERKEP